MPERPQSLRLAPPPERGRRIARRATAFRRPLGPLLQAAGRADQAILLALRTRGHSPGLDRAAGALGSFGELGSGWAAIGLGGALVQPARRRHWLYAAAAAPGAILANYAVKLTIGRQRPIIYDHPPLGRAPSKLSFPSAHATSALAAATVLGRVHPAGRIPYLLLATTICLGRPYLGMHYPSDVLAGAALGAVIGRIYPLPADGRYETAEGQPFSKERPPADIEADRPSEPDPKLHAPSSKLP